MALEQALGLHRVTDPDERRAGVLPQAAWRLDPSPGTGPGEVRIRIRGGSESLIAWSPAPLPIGTTVLVTDSRGRRTVDVMEWTDPLGEAPTIHGSTEVPRSGE